MRAAPEGGKANDALIRLVAQACGVAPKDVVLDRGGTSRIKILRINAEAPALLARLMGSCGKAKA